MRGMAVFKCTEMTVLVARASHRPCCDERELEASHTLSSPAAGSPSVQNLA